VFVELHARSAFSFLQGASQPEELVEVAASFNQPAIGILDRNGVYGSVRQHIAAKKLNIQAHIGAEIACTDGAYYPLLCESQTGYRNLCQLTTRLKMRAAKGEGAATIEEIAEFSEGLVCLAGAQDGPDLDKAFLIFGRDHTYAELQRHMHREQEARNQHLIELASRLNVPLLATNAPWHARPEQRIIADVLTCVREKVAIQDAGRLLARNAERHLKTHNEMARLFADVPRAIAITTELSRRLAFTMGNLGYEFPHFPTTGGQSMMSLLRELTWKGARERYLQLGMRERNQIERELDMIERLRLPGYFLIVWDIIRFCKENDILAQGRGSAANSAVCFSLGITAVDPIAMELLFERFLSEERGEWPDIDIDLPSGVKRERVIQYVYEHYGRNGAAMTANVISYRGRSAARDIGKVLGFDEDSVRRLAGLVRTFEWKDPNETPERNFKEAGFQLKDPRVRKFLELYVAVQDLPRHLGQHSGGMVICQGRLDSVVPLEPATMPGRTVVQWDKDDCADMGILKIDLLGLGMMAVLEDTIELVGKHYGEKVSLAHLPPNDAEVYASLQKADTIGLFQVESRAQMAVLPRVKPEKFYDLVVQVGIIRPGPIVGKMVNPYLRRRLGLEPPDYMHPSLEPILKRTLGVPLFQEQLLRMAMTVANFSGGEAEELRRAMGSKRSQKRMREVEAKMRAGMTANGIVGQQQDAIVHSITSFALYGFPESHAASFALLAYASAYLRWHYLPAFLAAMLNNQPMGFYHPATLVKDAQRHGLRILPIDVTQSDWSCTVVSPTTMRMGLRYIKGLREEAGRAIEAARKESPLSSIDDLVARVPELRKDELRALARTGALNFINAVHRRDAMWEAERVRHSAGSLLKAVQQIEQSSPLHRMTLKERLNADFTGTGLTVGRHPMSYYRKEMDKIGVCAATDLPTLRDGQIVKVAGAVIVRQRPGTAHGFVFLSLEDETGIANIIVEPKMFDRNKETLVLHPFLLVQGTLQNQQGSISIKAGKVEALEMNIIPAPSHNFH